jgi:excisionase family DNA binding protein
MTRHRYLSLATVADEHDISIKSLRRRVAEGTIPAYRVGSQLRIREADLDRLVRPVPAGRQL